MDWKIASQLYQVDSSRMYVIFQHQDQAELECNDFSNTTSFPVSSQLFRIQWEVTSKISSLCIIPPEGLEDFRSGDNFLIFLSVSLSVTTTASVLRKVKKLTCLLWIQLEGDCNVQFPDRHLHIQRHLFTRPYWRLEWMSWNDSELIPVNSDNFVLESQMDPKEESPARIVASSNFIWLVKRHSVIITCHWQIVVNQTLAWIISRLRMSAWPNLTGEALNQIFK